MAAIRLLELIIDGKDMDKSKTERAAEQRLFALIQRGQTDENELDRYTMATVECMLKRMRRLSDTGQLLLNRYALNQIQHHGLRTLFGDEAKFSRRFGVSFKWLQRYKWRIGGEEYENAVRDQSPHYFSSRLTHKLDNGDTFRFELKCYPFWSREARKCVLLSFHLLSLPESASAIQIECELLCHKNRTWRKAMQPQWLNLEDKFFCGWRTFASKCLAKNSSIKWVLGMKVVDTRPI